MAPLGIDFITTAAMASLAGSAGPKSSKFALTLCVLVALLGWAASYLIMLTSPYFGADATLAEDYVNGFSAGNAAVEIAVALAWTFLWFGLGRLALLVLRRGRNRPL